MFSDGNKKGADGCLPREGNTKIKEKKLKYLDKDDVV